VIVDDLVVGEAADHDQISVLDIGWITGRPENTSLGRWRGCGPQYA